MLRRTRVRYLAIILPGYILFVILTGRWTPFAKQRQHADDKTRSNCVESKADLFRKQREHTEVEAKCICVVSETNPKFAICPYQKEEDLYVSGSIRDTGIWDIDLTRLLKVALSLYKEAMFIDLGAFIGYFTLYAGALGHDVLSVEPFNSSFKRLKQGLAINEFLGTIKLLNKALSNQNSFIRMGKNQKLNLGNMQVEFEHHVDENRTALPTDFIEAVTMNDLIKYIHVKQAIVKMDIEGYECKAMEMSSAFFHQLFVPYIFMEWFIIRTNMKNIDTACTPEAAKQLVNDLINIGYTPYAYHTIFKLLDPHAVLEWEIDDVFWQHKSAISLLPFIGLIIKE